MDPGLVQLQGLLVVSLNQLLVPLHRVETMEVGVALEAPAAPASDPLLDAEPVAVLPIGVDDRVGRPLDFQYLLRYRLSKPSLYSPIVHKDYT